jgi:hypothetical protein
MSQFILIERAMATHGLFPVLLSSIDVDDNFLREVAMGYFGAWRDCRLVTDFSGSAESLIDDVCDAQLGGGAIEETVLVKFFKTLVESGVGFVVWHGGDCSNLPAAHYWSEVLERLRSQARLQPADVYLRFVPPDACGE